MVLFGVIKYYANSKLSLKLNDQNIIIFYTSIRLIIENTLMRWLKCRKNIECIKIPLLINPKSFEMNINYDDKKLPFSICNENSRKITEMKIINTFDINDVVKSYPYIKFENLDDKVKTYIATGDKIINTFDNDKSSDLIA